MSCVFYIPEPLAREYKTHKEFHKKRMKWKFILDSFYHNKMIIHDNSEKYKYFMKKVCILRKSEVKMQDLEILTDFNFVQCEFLMLEGKFSLLLFSPYTWYKCLILEWSAKIHLCRDAEIFFNKQVKIKNLNNNASQNNDIYAAIFHILCQSEWSYASQNRLICYFQHHCINIVVLPFSRLL